MSGLIPIKRQGFSSPRIPRSPNSTTVNKVSQRNPEVLFTMSPKIKVLTQVFSLLSPLLLQLFFYQLLPVLNSPSPSSTWLKRCCFNQSQILKKKWSYIPSVLPIFSSMNEPCGEFYGYRSVQEFLVLRGIQEIDGRGSILEEMQWYALQAAAQSMVWSYSGGDT